MTVAEARKRIVQLWEHGNGGAGDDVRDRLNLAELTERGMLEAWDAADGRRFYMVTAEGKEFADCRQDAAEKIGRRR